MREFQGHFVGFRKQKNELFILFYLPQHVEPRRFEGRWEFQLLSQRIDFGFYDDSYPLVCL